VTTFLPHPCTDRDKIRLLQRSLCVTICSHLHKGADKLQIAMWLSINVVSGISLQQLSLLLKCNNVSSINKLFEQSVLTLYY